MKPFQLEALVDFVDDAIKHREPITRTHLDSMMARLAEMGIRRVAWGYYGDGRGGLIVPGCLDAQWANYAATYAGLGNPLRAAVEVGHRHGLEVYGYFKPYETGPAVAVPEGAPEAGQCGLLPQLGGQLVWLDPFVVKHPHLRIARRQDDLPAVSENAPVCAIRLVKRDAGPTRIMPEHLQIWTSENNYRYRPLPQSFQFTEEVVPAGKDIYDICGHLVTRCGDPVRMLTLSGFSLTDRCILVATDFQEGPADFENTGTELMVALDAQGRPIPGVFAGSGAVWLREQVDYREWGLVFDYGFSRALMRLDEPRNEQEAGRKGFIAFTRGRNRYLPGALCETEPEVQAFWLACIDEMLDAGVDGIDFREENHSTHTDYPEEYGFNPVVLERCQQRGGTDLLKTVAAVRGEAYTDFLRRAKQRIAARGVRMRYHLNVDYFRPDPPPERQLAYPANIRFEWDRWIDEGLLDEAVLRFYQLPMDAVFADPVALAMTERCRHQNIPLCVNRYVHNDEGLVDEFRRVYRHPDFTGFILYETATYLTWDAPEQCRIAWPVIEEIGEMTRDGGVSDAL